ncbi:WD40 repeat-like protein [Thelephora ganbajun]|uniref:WD40 repeat-like protein n=1 Tax=Thelephora ganbajun TaxID=370292 RepID=A0ACB6Z2P2_THEGA|nr:WD40 repeat-like protein [Thelephora ganbajun]
MYHVADAGYLCGDRQGCMKGTRKDVLLQIEQWSKDEQDKRVFWLNGLAGTGKSTIAQTFAEMCFADGKLGASFFCSRDFDDRSNLRSIFPTLAFQLAHKYPQFREKLLPVLMTNPDVHREALCSQMEKLIVRPFQVMKIPTLIVIDALDECRDEEPASALLSVLSRYVDNIPLVKFFIAGRPEPRIRSGFRLESLRPHTDVLKLHEVESSSVDSDIRLFLKARFIEIAKNRSDCSFVDDWPGPHNIEILCKKAAGFFIYASIVVKFVASRHYPPDERLALTISLPQDTSHEGKSGIDLLYTQVLEQAFHDVDSHDHEPYSRFKSVVGAILLTFHPLSIKTLSDLLSNCGTPSRMSSALRTLHSVLLVPDNIEDPVCTFHKSFSDFLTDPGRCIDHQFLIDPPTYHREILLSCLNVMKERLKGSICNLDDNVVLSKIEDLPGQRTAYIGDALKYACYFWARHLAKIPSSGYGVEEVYEAIDKFFETNFLFWIEVLILIGNLNIGIYALNDIEQWYMLTGVPCKWTSDSKNFILENFDTIYNSPSWIYNSALTLCPPSSWLHGYYTGGIKVVVGPTEWGICTRTAVCNEDYPTTLTYWNNTIAAGLKDNITIFDAITGSQTAVLSGHTDRLRSITFSLDGTLLVSGSKDQTIKLWDVQTGGIVKTFHGHTDWVQSVSISADKTTIASGSVDKTICVWDVGTGKCHVIKGYNDYVTIVSFHPTNSQLLLFAFKDGTVQQWGIHSHQIGPSITSCYPLFSSDGTQFVSRHKTAVTIQNTDSGEVVAKFDLPNNYPGHCCFSPDGKFIAASTGHTIYLWDITGPDPHLIKTLIGHTQTITSLIFPSSHTLISASEDRSIKFWQTSDLSAAPVTPNAESTPLTSAPIKVVSLQVKDGLAFSVDSTGVVKTWDIVTGLCKESSKTPAKGIKLGDMQLINGRFIIVWCKKYEREIYFWDAEKGKLQTVNTHHQHTIGLRISGDESRVFQVTNAKGKESIQVWSIWTGELMGKVELECNITHRFNPLHMDGTKILVNSGGLLTQCWDFGTPGSTPIQLSEISSDRPHLDFIDIRWWSRNEPVRVEDRITGKEVFQLPGRYANPSTTQWDGQYLIAGYESGEVLILDFGHMLL